MARPRNDAHDEATPKRILRAAERAFAEQGFHGARLADIAAAADIRRPSLLHHFGSKEALHEAVIATLFEDIGSVLLGALDGEAPLHDRLRRGARAFLAFLDERHAVAPLILRELLDPSGRRRLMRGILPILNAVEQLIAAETDEATAQRVPVRSALLQFSAHAIVRAASRELRVPIWGAEESEDELLYLLVPAT